VISIVRATEPEIARPESATRCRDG
jgi:hypothetical protein